MGSEQSYPGLTQDVIEDYASLTYLNKGEILHVTLVYCCGFVLTSTRGVGLSPSWAEAMKKLQASHRFLGHTELRIEVPLAVDLMKKFYSIDPEKLQNNPQHRFDKSDIINKFAVLKNNPFQDRIFHVFSSLNDDCFSFEDLLDLCSAMSSECPIEVKAAWAFKIFDLDDDNQITANDICQIVDRLTCFNENSSHYIDEESKTKISDVILKEINLDLSGGIGLNEFKLVICRLPEFASSFYFRL